MDQQGAKSISSEFPIDQFVGREDPLGVIEAAIADVPRRYVFMISGEAGVGKTALLRELARRYRSREKAEATAVIQLDYSQASFQSLPILVENFLAQALGPERIVTHTILGEYNRLYEKAQHAFLERRDEKVVELLQDAAYRYLIEQVNQRSPDRRLLILSDTIEASSDLSMGRRVNELAAEFDNAVIIVAGRPQAEVMNRYDDEYPLVYGTKGWNLQLLTLKAFSPEEVSEYFDNVLPFQLSEDVKIKLALLTNCKPVLLAIATEWLKRNIALPKGMDKSSTELYGLEGTQELKTLQQEFEYELIGSIRAVQEPVHQTLVVMSFLDRRYDQQILQLALDLPLDQIGLLEAQLRRMAFTRSFLDSPSDMLHDEAKRMIQTYVWPSYDPEGEEGRALAKKVIEGYYLPEIRKLRQGITKVIEPGTDARLLAYRPEERLAHELEMECLDYCYRISRDSGRLYLTELINQGVSLMKREGIRAEIGSRVGEEEQDVAEARMNVARGYRNAKITKVLEQAFSKPGAMYQYRIRLLQELRAITAEPSEQISYLERAIELAKQNDDRKVLAEVYNDMGLMYRRQGLWQKAESAYTETFKLLEVASDPEQKAATLNNLAYVKLLQGELDLAEELADIALAQRTELGNQLHLAFSFMTRGQIAETKNEIDQALSSYRTAASLFERLGPDPNHADALIHLARAERLAQDYAHAVTLLTPGLSQPESETRAKAERELGALRRTEAGIADGSDRIQKLEEASQAFLRSLNISVKRQDYYGQAQALLDLISLEFHNTGIIPKDSVDRLQALLSGRDYAVIEARLEKLYADDAYNHGEVKFSFQRYLEVAFSLSKLHIRHYEELYDQLKRKFRSQPIQTQQELCNAFNEFARALPEGSRLRIALANFCRAVKIAYSAEFVVEQDQT